MTSDHVYCLPLTFYMKNSDTFTIYTINGCQQHFYIRFCLVTIKKKMLLKLLHAALKHV